MDAIQIANLKDFVQNNFPDELTCGDYYSTFANCGCVVGEMLIRVCDVDPIALTDLGSYIEDWSQIEEGDKLDWANQLVELFGMTPAELTSLQRVNDTYYEDEKGTDGKILRSQEVKKYLEDLITKREKEVFA